MTYSVVRGKKLRATRVDACGTPLPGPKAQIVTEATVTLTYDRVWNDAEDLEQKNANGKLCVVDRTPPELKWHTVELNICNADVELLAMFTDLPLILDYAGKPVGIRENKSVMTDAGVAIEFWSGTGNGSCDVPQDDDWLAAGASASRTPYGYWLSPVVKEATMGSVELGASVTTFTLSGITAVAPGWGRGPYDVVEIDSDLTPGRLLTPFLSDEDFHMQRTLIAPPAVTNGAVPLALPTPYYGASAADNVDA